MILHEKLSKKKKRSDNEVKNEIMNTLLDFENHIVKNNKFKKSIKK